MEDAFVGTDQIHSILEATRTIAWMIRQDGVDGIPPRRLRRLGMALLYAGEGDLEKTKEAIAAAALIKLK